jgi:hypothetical protein
MTATTPATRTPARRKARELAKHLRGERPDYAYLKEVFRHLRAELDIEITRQPKTLPYVPTQDEIRRYYPGPEHLRQLSDRQPAPLRSASGLGRYRDGHLG